MQDTLRSLLIEASIYVADRRLELDTADLFERINKALVKDAEDAARGQVEVALDKVVPPLVVIERGIPKPMVDQEEVYQVEQEGKVK